MIKAPIVFAISGHRDIAKEHEDRLKFEIIKIINENKAKYPDTPLVFLSPLAEGADQIAALAALETDCKLFVPIPMDEEIYLKVFDDESRKRYEELKKKAKKYFVIPCKTCNSKDDYYVNIGDFISSHAHILIAAWDGVINNKPGGTGYIVQKKLEGVDGKNGFALPDVSKIMHIRTPRLSNPDITRKFQIVELFPSIDKEIEEDAVSFDEMLKQLDDFNADLKIINIKKDEFFFPSAIGNEALNNLREIYDTTNFLAMKYQSYYKKKILISIILTLLAIICFEIGTASNEMSALLIVYLVIFGTLFVLNANILPTSQWKRKYLDYRAIAEAMRAHMAWTLSGVNEKIHLYYLRKQNDEIHWIRKYLQYLSIEKESGFENIDQVKKEWIDDQINYFKKRTKERAEDKEALSTFSLSLYLLGFILSLVFLCLSMHQLADYAVWFASPVALSAAIGAYLHLTGWEEESRQYMRSYKIFSQAQKSLEECTDIKKSKDILFELGKEALRENGDWLMLHRQRKIENKL